MTVLYVLLAVAVAWIVYAALSKKPPPIEPSVRLGESPQSGPSHFRSSEGDDKDDWEGSFWEVVQPLPTKARLRLHYTDGAGNKTERTVDVRQFGALGNTTLLIGNCLLRGATRTFRTDRIQRCVDEETGEVVADVPGYLAKKYAESPEHSSAMLVESEYDTLRILLYVGKADGQLRAAEKTVIRETCVALAHDSRLTDAMIDDLLQDMEVPTLHAFKLAVGRIAKRGPEACEIVRTASEKMVATQTTVHQAEQDALDYMHKRFANPST